MIRRWRAVAALALGVGAAITLLAGGAGVSGYAIRWNTNSKPVAVEVSGVSAHGLQLLRGTNWQLEAWQKLFSVYAGFGPATNLPPMLGNYAVGGDGFRFEPSFPLDPGVTYRAVFRPACLPGAEGRGSADVNSTIRIGTAHRGVRTSVTQVYPSAKVLPANLLKFYVYFSEPMSRGNIYEHIKLVDETGKAVELPFLEIDQELWNPEMTRLTLFIDPGRIKRGVKPLEEIGPVLVEGKRYTLVIDRDWRDAEGSKLKAGFRKPFKAGPPAREPLALAQWKVLAPKNGTRQALQIHFPSPMDYALAQRMIRVTHADRRIVPGKCVLKDNEQSWCFTPEKSWGTGAHKVIVETTIEDLAGNNIGKPFEVDLFEGVQRGISNETVSLAFEVRGAQREEGTGR